MKLHSNILTILLFNNGPTTRINFSFLFVFRELQTVPLCRAVPLYCVDGTLRTSYVGKFIL